MGALSERWRHQHGLASLTAEERAQIATDLDLTDKKHRAWFDALMEDMGGGSDPHNPHGKPEPDATGSDAAPPAGPIRV